MASEIYAGRSQDERVAMRKGKSVPAQEQAGGKMAVPGTASGPGSSCGQLSEEGKEVWRTGNGEDSTLPDRK